LSVISGEENIHPAYDSLHDVMRTIWNDPRWFFARVQGELLPPAHPQRLERPTSYGGHVIRGARVCFCLMLFVNCCTLSLELLNYHPVRGKTAST
jgi:hypothetical protein